MGIACYPRLVLLLGLWFCFEGVLAATDTSFLAPEPLTADSIPPTPAEEVTETPSVDGATPLFFTRITKQIPAPKPPEVVVKKTPVIPVKPPPVVVSADRVLPLEVTINGAKSGSWLLLERNGEMYAPGDAFDEWRVQIPPTAKPIDTKLFGQTYYPLAAIPGYKFKLDFATQTADLQFAPQVFTATQLVQETTDRPVLSPVLPSAFVNYDLNYAVSNLRDTTATKDLGAVTEIGASNAWGVLTSSQAGSNLTDDKASAARRKWVRLETTLTKDFPGKNLTLRLGDAVTPAGTWARNVYFGGVQYGSNFALTPGFVSQPIPTLPGVSTAPSTVEMYVNDVLRQTSNVPAGPFSIDNFPLLTGSGDVKMVIRDTLGRETVIEQSFFTSADLLATGLNDWSVEAGRIRRNMGIDSNKYGTAFVSGSWRRGYNDQVTLAGHAEVTRQLRAIGGSVVAALPKQIQGEASLALSNGTSQNGMLWMLGAEHQTLHSSTSLQVQGASTNFHQLGQADTTAPIKLQVAGNWSYDTEKKGTFGLGVATLSRFDNTRVSTISSNYSTKIGERNNLSFTASRAINGTNGTSLGVFLVVPLDNNRIVSASASGRSGEQDFYVSATQNPTQESNLGWRGLAGYQQKKSRVEGGAYYLSQYGRFSGDASLSTDQSALRLGANGGLVLVNNKLFVTQRVDQSYAIAEVAGYKNVGVGLGSNMMSHTDKKGVALIPRLIPYQNNSVRLDPGELPISAEIDSLEQSAVPAWRSAVKVVFPVRGGQGALLKIKFDDGEVAPAGATVHIENDKQEFYVARRGEAFVTGLQANNRVVLNWNGQQCKFDVVLPSEITDNIPRIDSLLCSGISR